MDDLISRQAAIATAISGRVRTLSTTEDGEDWIRVSEVRESLYAVPSIDAVPVIRCKDCKYAYITNDGECKYCDIWFPVEAKYLDGDYYCASAEREES